MADQLTKKRAAELIDQLQTKQAELAKLTAKRDAELQPFVEQFQADTAPINEKYTPKMQPISKEIAGLKKQLEDFLVSGFDVQTGAVKLSMLESTVVKGRQLVAVVKVGSSRVLSPEKVFEKVKERTAEFWGMFTVGLQKAESLLGKKFVDELAAKKYTASVTFETREVQPTPKAKATAVEG